ncbi:MAG: acetyl-CoA carboxylase biotin carboxyl carrier protein [Saprospiraceae bacterium]|jgi:acetyl-CoA carboxylase biotin carboxyl carrier protein|nr:acetyl-CoA carboxylase biotin carboxyl carrier protein [Saprospiraceae bacterium]MBP9209851.1 acetyl-CoA carboxylase biotin carboxyl carrier protein [Saprospiraceae bacterium]MBV6473747.1 Biotin carboxyl carrier protein of acetyl-CoA carboxylase [Saprospiraceae bacterium]
MNFKEIQELLRLVSKSGVSTFKIKDGDFEMTIKSGQVQAVAPVVVAAAPVVPAAVSPVVPRAEEAETPKSGGQAAAATNYLEVRSPMVGTFYRAPGPDKSPFVKVGDRIEAGQTVCIIEAMKLFNEIESEVSGTIVKVVVEDASPVEYDQVLFLVEP